MELSKLTFDVQCPSCQTTLGDHVSFRWGVCPRSRPYALGEPVEWLRSPDGDILPPGEQLGDYHNVGDPELGDVVVRDRSAFDFGAQCPVCEEGYAGVVTAVKGGHFAGASIYERGDLPTDDDIFEVRADGSLVPHPELIAPLSAKR